MNQKLELSKLVDVIHHTALNVCCLILYKERSEVRKSLGDIVGATEDEERANEMAPCCPGEIAALCGIERLIFYDEIPETFRRSAALAGAAVRAGHRGRCSGQPDRRRQILEGKIR